MSSLHLRVPLGPGETAGSFCSRLALRNGCSTMNEFCRDMGLAAQGITNGTERVLERLATLADLDPRLLSATAIRQEGRNHVYAGQIFNRAMLRRDVVKICPACIADDMARWARFGEAAPYGRFAWLVASIRTCDIHDLELVEAVDTADVFWSARHDFARLLRPVLPRLDRLLGAAERRQPTSFEAYLMHRLGGAQGGGWLQDMPFYAAARACEAVGTLAAYGLNALFTKMTPAEQRNAGVAGFEIIAGGTDRLNGLLDDLSASAPDSRNVGPINLYGQFYRWLWEVADDDAYRPLCECVREKIMDTMALGPDDMILGRRVEVRRFHSVRSIAQEHGVHAKRLRRLLQDAGFIRETDIEKTDDRILIPADADLDEFLKRTGRFLSRHAAAAYINAPRAQFDMLMCNGFVAPSARRDGSRTRPTFDEADLHRFLEELFAHSTAKTDGDEGLATIPEAKRIAHHAAAGIVGMVLAGQLSKIRRDPNSNGYLSVLVDPREVRSLVHDERHRGLSIREVTRLMKWSDVVATALIDNGLIACETVINPITQMRQRLVSEESLNEFDRRYVSLHVLAKGRGIHFLKLKRSLDASGILPAFDPGAIGARFYLRAELP